MVFTEVQQPREMHPLYQNSVCQWAGCDTPCRTAAEFLEHLLRHHGLNDMSTAQCRVQTQAVKHLETQLKRERERLSAMMAHLHTLPSKSLSIDAIFSLHQNFPESPPSPPRQDSSPPRSEGISLTSLSRDPLHRSFSLPITSTKPRDGLLLERAHLPTTSVPGLSLTSPVLPVLPTLSSIYENMLPRMTSPKHRLPLGSTSQHLPLGSNPSQHLPLGSNPSQHISLGNSLSQRLSLVSNSSQRLSLASVTSPTHYEITAECRLKNSSAPAPGSILANAALYQNPTVKPPFTYASLIREAIMNSLNKRLSLNEIYTWFGHHFTFFRFNTSQWKNAVRHNLSLHKCFQRVEGPTGSGWTVNENEFQLRRANRVTSTRSLEDDAAVAIKVPDYMKNLMEQVNVIHDTLERTDKDMFVKPIVTSWSAMGTAGSDSLPSRPGAFNLKLEKNDGAREWTS